MVAILVALHLLASGLALLSGGLALVVSGRGVGSVPGRWALFYVGSVGVMSISSLGLFRETGGFHALHGVAVVLMALVLPSGWAMVRCPGNPAIFRRHRRIFSGTYLVLLVSTVLETARRLVAPVLAARGFESWEVYWAAVGLLAAGMALVGLRLVRTRRDDVSREGDSLGDPEKERG